MGCIWSGEDANRCAHCNRRPRNNLIFIDNVCEICIAQASRPASSFQLKRRYGEYRCSCGRYWTSARSWARSFQICMNCGAKVYAFNQRELRPSDTGYGDEARAEHPKEYCQMCQQLGYDCGNYGKKVPHTGNRRKHYSR